MLNKKDQEDKHLEEIEPKHEEEGDRIPDEIETKEEPKQNVQSTAGDGFFDDFANSNLNEENDRGRGRGGGSRGRGGPRGRGRGGYNNNYHRGGYNQRGRYGQRGSGRGRGYHEKNYDNYDKNDGYYQKSEDAYQKSDDHYSSQQYKKPNNKEFDEDLSFNPYGSHTQGFESDMSFPEYKPPSATYRGSTKRGSANQGMKGRTDRGRFSYFSTGHDET
jgi:hypothetical protein